MIFSVFIDFCAKANILYINDTIMDKGLRDKLAVQLFKDCVSDKAFEKLLQHNYYNREFKRDFAQEMILQFYEVSDDMIDKVWNDRGYESIKSFYFRMCIYQLISRHNKMNMKWLDHKGLYLDVTDKDLLDEYGVSGIDTKIIDMEDFNLLFYNEDINEQE